VFAVEHSGFPCHREKGGGSIGDLSINRRRTTCGAAIDCGPGVSAASVMPQLTPHRQFLISIRNSNGRCECFVGLTPSIIPSVNFGIEIPAALMRALADLGLDLGIGA
jgi:hypothetical protein